MRVESEADRASFFNPDEFGELVRYQFGGDPAIEVVADWKQPTALAAFANTDVNLDVHRFLIDRAIVPNPRQKGTITIVATGEVFTINHQPQLTDDGKLWVIQAA